MASKQSGTQGNVAAIRALPSRDIRFQRDAERYLLYRKALRVALGTAGLVAVDGGAVVAALDVLSALSGVGWIGVPALTADAVGGSGALMVMALAAVGMYRRGEAERNRRRIVGAAVLGGILATFLVSPWKDTASWPAVALLMASVATAVFAGRILVEGGIRSLGRIMAPKRVVCVGEGEGVRRAAAYLSGAPQLVVSGWFDVESRTGSAGNGVDVGALLDRQDVDTVLITSPLAPQALRAVSQAAFSRGVPVQLVSIAGRDTELALEPRVIHGLPVFDVQPREGGVPAMTVKRTIDVVAALCILLLLSPLLALLAIAIRLDSEGPVFFRQTRVGGGGRTFEMWKFRTMVANADEMKAELLEANESGDPRLFNISSDPRVTRVGAWLRRLSLDELPQLFNVLRGEMSLVGPRPFFPEDLELYEQHHMERLTVLPGITGLWQVSGRSDIRDFDTVVELDREYIRNWSVGLDLIILLRTIPVVLNRDGAY